jgi:hypothetical protein
VRYALLQSPGLFPGFPDPPAGSRTPTLGKQKAGAGAAAGGSGSGGGGVGPPRGRKASKATGRLFAADNSTPRYAHAVGWMCPRTVLVLWTAARHACMLVQVLSWEYAAGRRRYSGCQPLLT